MQLTLFSILLITQNLSAEAWRLDKDENGIKIYTRDVAGSNIRQFKAETIINAPLKILLVVFLDFDDYPSWFHQTSKAHLVTKVSPLERYSYQDLTMPFPMDDRDLLVHSIIENRGNSVVIRSKAQADYCLTAPEKNCQNVFDEDNIKVDYFKSEHYFKPLKGEKIKLTWLQHIEPKGDVPTWLVNQALIDVPFYSFEKLRKQVQLERYQNMQFEDM